jgi:hypothetical protein
MDQYTGCPAGPIFFALPWQPTLARRSTLPTVDPQEAPEVSHRLADASESRFQPMARQGDGR